MATRLDLAAVIFSKETLNKEDREDVIIFQSLHTIWLSLVNTVSIKHPDGLTARFGWRPLVIENTRESILEIERNSRNMGRGNSTSSMPKVKDMHTLWQCQYILGRRHRNFKGNPKFAKYSACELLYFQKFFRPSRMQDGKAQHEKENQSQRHRHHLS